MCVSPFLSSSFNQIEKFLYPSPHLFLFQQEPIMSRFALNLYEFPPPPPPSKS